MTLVFLWLLLYPLSVMCERVLRQRLLERTLDERGRRAYQRWNIAVYIIGTILLYYPTL